ncbi:MAG: zf-HC2 domain-containing protein [Myxococcota bacterium]
MTQEARQVRCPEAVLGWIPWYAEGGLSERQMGLVEAHAAECGDCRSEIDMVSGAPFEVDFDLPDPERMFDEITARIEEREAAEAGGAVIPIDRARALSVGDLETIESWVLDSDTEVEDEALALEEREGFRADLFPEFADGQTPEPIEAASGDWAEATSPAVSESNLIEGPWARKAIWAAAAALALFLMGGLGGSLLAGGLQGESQTGDYALAGAAPAELPSSPQIDVVFLDSASAREVSNTLRAEGLEIVSGPSGLGVYRLALTQTDAQGEKASASDAAAISARLAGSESPIAMFAEPVP